MAFSLAPRASNTFTVSTRAHFAATISTVSLPCPPQIQGFTCEETTTRRLALTIPLASMLEPKSRK
jgi:hypothetical protein